jgi:hypothetical protein
VENHPLLFALLISGFGGLVRYVQRFTGKPEERPRWEWSVACITVGTGAFAGVLTLWIIRKKLGPDGIDYVHVLVALAGYGGPLTIETLWEACRDVLRRMLGAAPDAKNDAPKS